MPVSDRRAYVEFLTLAAIVAIALLGLVALAVAGVASDSPITGVLSDIVKVGFGAVVALAYAARGVVKRTPGDEVTLKSKDGPDAR